MSLVDRLLHTDPDAQDDIASHEFAAVLSEFRKDTSPITGPLPGLGLSRIQWKVLIARDFGLTTRSDLEILDQIMNNMTGGLGFNFDRGDLEDAILLGRHRALDGARTYSRELFKQRLGIVEST